MQAGRREERRRLGRGIPGWSEGREICRAARCISCICKSNNESVMIPCFSPPQVVLSPILTVRLEQHGSGKSEPRRRLLPHVYFSPHLTAHRKLDTDGIFPYEYCIFNQSLSPVVGPVPCTLRIAAQSMTSPRHALGDSTAPRLVSMC